MILPPPLRSVVEDVLAAQIRAVEPVGGGCISHATRVTTEAGEHAFLKWGGQGELPTGIFQAEAHSLKALGAARAVRVPSVIDCSDHAGAAYGWLLLEWIEPARLSLAAWRELGSALAALHCVSHRQFGWSEANFIGSLPQANSWSADWPSFWRSERLLPQVEAATRKGLLRPADRARVDRLLDALDDILGGDRDGPSLLHGDLWNGNVHGTAGGAVLIDPASYYGHREVDLAMAALFGGFPAEFFEAYDRAWPLQPDADRREAVYQLYYLLVHVNLFGGSYVPGTLSAVGELGF